MKKVILTAILGIALSFSVSAKEEIIKFNPAPLIENLKINIEKSLELSSKKAFEDLKIEIDKDLKKVVEKLLIKKPGTPAYQKTYSFVRWVD